MRKIIILDVEPLESGDVVVEAALWFPVPTVARPRRNGSATSAVPNVTKDELNAIKAGRIVERVVRTGNYKTQDVATVPTALIETYNETQAQLASSLAGNMMIGREWDGTGWSVGTGDFVPVPAEQKPTHRADADPSEAIVAALADVVEKLEVLIEMQGSK